MIRTVFPEAASMAVRFIAETVSVRQRTFSLPSFKAPIIPFRVCCGLRQPGEVAYQSSLPPGIPEPLLRVSRLYFRAVCRAVDCRTFFRCSTAFVRLSICVSSCHSRWYIPWRNPFRRTKAILSSCVSSAVRVYPAWKLVYHFILARDRKLSQHGLSDSWIKKLWNQDVAKRFRSVKLLAVRVSVVE